MMVLYCLYLFHIVNEYSNKLQTVTPFLYIILVTVTVVVMSP